MKAKSIAASALLAALALSASLGAAKADVRYLVDAAFGDGASLTGYFYINSYGYVGNYDLTTTSGAQVAGFHYVSGLINVLTGPSSTPPFSSLQFQRDNYDGSLALTFANNLQGYGVHPLVFGYSSWEDMSYMPGSPPTRLLTSGTVTGVPEPSSWALALIGFAALGFAAHRTRKSSAAAA